MSNTTKIANKIEKAVKKIASSITDWLDKKEDELGIPRGENPHLFYGTEFPIQKEIYCESLFKPGIPKK